MTRSGTAFSARMNKEVGHISGVEKDVRGQGADLVSILDCIAGFALMVKRWIGGKSGLMMVNSGWSLVDVWVDIG